jgi:hypothetical protein
MLTVFSSMFSSLGCRILANALYDERLLRGILTDIPFSISFHLFLMFMLEVCTFQTICLYPCVY